MKHKRKISVIGLGYVGLPVAVAFGKVQEVVGFDINKKRIEELRSGKDLTNEVSSKDLKESKIIFTADPSELKKADFHIVAVPTPVDSAKQPDLSPMIGASRTVGEILKKGDIVVYESTVYPGATEEKCLPVLEKHSGLKAGKDFFVGYSPERINPGDKEHSFTKITKVVSGMDGGTLEIVANVYESVVTAGVHRASSIKVAESAKVIENIQRDVNIALMNELALIFHKLNIDTQEVLAASRTKWNFLPFTPGLVGGHCIGVDPYYLTHKAAELGYAPQVILAGRRINDDMGAYIASHVVKCLIADHAKVNGAIVTIFGFTFKEDVPDLRNTKVIDIVNELREYGVTVQICDPHCDAEEAEHEYGIKLTEQSNLLPADAIVLAVAHSDFRQKSWSDWQKFIKPDARTVIDVKAMLPKGSVPEKFHVWRL